MNLNIVSEFLNYAKITVNSNKCHSLSCIIREGRRFYEEEQFIIAHEPIPVCTLADSIEYLGTSAATTKLIRKHGIAKAIEETKELIEKINQSVLTLNQKNIYAIKTFAIPKLDFILINGRASLKNMNNIDRQIRVGINRHVKGTSLPIPLFYIHWKDGGFSIQKLHDRALSLRAKSFMALCNSQSIKIR